VGREGEIWVIDFRGDGRHLPQTLELAVFVGFRHTTTVINAVRLSQVYDTEHMTSFTALDRHYHSRLLSIKLIVV